MTTADRQVLNEKADTGPLINANAVIDVVRQLVKEVHPHRATALTVHLDSALDRDVGLDSLTRVELIARLEHRFHVTLPERTFSDAETPRDLLRALLGAHATTPTTARAAPPPQPLSLDKADAVPHTGETLIDVLYWHVQQHPDRPHIQLYQDDGQGEVITYGQLWQQAKGVAAALQQRGITRGDPVALMLPTGNDYFITFFGVLFAGGVPVSMYPPARPTQIEDHLRRHETILANCQASTFITVSEAKIFGRLLKSLVETIQHVETVADLAGDPNTWDNPGVSGHDTAFLQYTSGSTGNPKGVVLSHANLLANIRAMGSAVEARSQDVFVSWLPLYHDMGLIGAWLGSLYFSCLFVVMSPLAFISRPQRWLWAIAQTKGSLSAAPNFAYELCLNRLQDEDLEGLDLSSWRIAFNGAEAISPVTLERFCDRFARWGFRREAMMPVYGLAESSVGLAFPPVDRGPLIDSIQREPFTRSGHAVSAAAANTTNLRFVACGCSLDDHQIRIVDEADRELPDRQEGHLQFRGPSTTSGYFRNAEATRRLFHGDWLDSGDMAYMDRGEVYITGRVKDIIIRAGRNIYPQELEEAVGEVEGVRKGRVAVFGCPDAESGTERLVIMAETRLEEAAAREKIRTTANTVAIDLTGAPPDEVVLAPPGTVLKTSSGKIRRAASRDIYQQGLMGKAQAAPWWQISRVALISTLPVLRRTRRSIITSLYAANSWIVFWILAPLSWLAVALLPRESHRWSVMRKATRLLAFATRTPFTVRGVEHLPPSDQPCMLVANHASYLDGPILIAALPRQFSYVAKTELKDSMIPRVFLERISTEFVERFDKERGALDATRLADLTQGGRTLFFFPEGTFSRKPGLLPFRMGAFLAAAEARIPVVPITIRGTRSILRSGTWFPRHGAVSVVVGQPIAPMEHEDSAQGRWQSAIQLRDAARTEILRQCGEPDLSRDQQLF